MSALTPLSFIDDGASFARRTPYSLHPSQISAWLDNAGSTTPHSPVSTYTGSFIDDGADLLPPRAQQPGFGAIDARFYKQKKRSERAEAVVWNEAVQKAITGDLQRNLDKIRGLGHVGVCRGDGEGLGRRNRGETVRVPVPRVWGTFVIRGDHGRVIVVERDGEFDSGMPKVEEEAQGKRWVKAESTAPSEVLKKPSTRMDARPCVGREDRELSGGADDASPTEFVMTGGASGWPSSASTNRDDADSWPMGRGDCSTYKAPTVEDGRNTSSESVVSVDQKGWRGSAAGDARWDGFEKIKTDSEVSVAGSGSERSALAWGGSHVSRHSWSSEKARVDDDGWSRGSAHGFDQGQWQTGHVTAYGTA